MEDKTDRLLEAMEHPGRFSDEEIRLMLEDDEARELYRLMSRTSDALTETKEPDLDNEWESFAAEHAETIHKPFYFFGMFSSRKVAAVLTGAVSLAAVAATVAVTYSLSRPKVDEAAQITEETGIVLTKDTVNVNSDSISPLSPAAEPTTVVFKDETFENVIGKIAGYYGVTVKYNSESAKALRLYFQWDQRLPLNEVVDQLNSFEQLSLKLSGNTITIE